MSKKEKLVGKHWVSIVVALATTIALIILIGSCLYVEHLEESNTVQPSPAIEKAEERIT